MLPLHTVSQTVNLNESNNFFHQCFLILSFFDHPLHRFSFAHLKNLCHKVNMTTTSNCPVIKFPKVSSWRFFIFPFSYFRRLVRGRSIKEANYLEETPSVIYGENLNWSPQARIHKYKIQNTNTQVLMMALMMIKVQKVLDLQLNSVAGSSLFWFCYQCWG